jgi:heme exporter protein C
VTLGAIWAKPTWGVYWDWDPRLTTAAIMIVIYAGYLALRSFIEDPDKRATWSAVLGIFAFVDLPVLWYSVKWWKSLHQVQSTPKTVDPDMTLVLRWSSATMLALLFVFVVLRFRIAIKAREAEVAPPPVPAR